MGKDSKDPGLNTEGSKKQGIETPPAKRKRRPYSFWARGGKGTGRLLAIGEKKKKGHRCREKSKGDPKRKEKKVAGAETRKKKKKIKKEGKQLSKRKRKGRKGGPRSVDPNKKGRKKKKSSWLGKKEEEEMQIANYQTTKNQRLITQKGIDRPHMPGRSTSIRLGGRA